MSQFALTWVRLLALTLITAALPFFSAGAQANSTTGTVCVLAYHDANQNGVRDAGEEALPEVSFNLMIASNVLVANHVALQGEPYCFENLPAQQYTLSAASPLYVPIDGAVTFALQEGAHLTYQFGALYRAPQSVSLPEDALIVIPMTMSVRLGMSVGAALIVMLTLSGIGMVIYGMFFHRRLALISAPRSPAVRTPPAKAVRETGSRRVASERLKRSTRQFEPLKPTSAEVARTDLPRSERYSDLDSLDEDDA